MTKVFIAQDLVMNTALDDSFKKKQYIEKKYFTYNLARIIKGLGVLVQTQVWEDHLILITCLVKTYLFSLSTQSYCQSTQLDDLRLQSEAHLIENKLHSDKMTHLVRDLAPFSGFAQYH